MDPIAFFDHLAANSLTSRSSIEGRSIASTSLNTVKQNGEAGYQDFTEAYRTEAKGIMRYNFFFVSMRILIIKKALSEHLKDQFVALDQVEEYFNQSHTELQQKIESTYQELQKDLNDHQTFIQAEKLKHDREKELIAQVCKFQDEKVCA